MCSPGFSPEANVEGPLSYALVITDAPELLPGFIYNSVGGIAGALAECANLMTDYAKSTAE